MEKFLVEDDFLDHCHPLPKGQEKMAKKFKNYMHQLELKETQKRKSQMIYIIPN